MQALQAQIAGLSPQFKVSQAHSQAVNSSSAEFEDVAVDEESSLADKIQRLSELVLEKSGTTYEKDAEPIIAELESLV